MNYLQLCQRLRQEVGGSGTGNPPSVLNQQGENKLYVDWVDQAWREIQNLRNDWDFHWTELSTVITTGLNSITLPADFKIFDNDSLFINGNKVDLVDWDTMRTMRIGTPIQSGRPTYASIAPDKTLKFNATADQDYTLIGEYYITPQNLTANTDVPLLPERYHMLIIYKAMLFYASYENAPEVAPFAMMQFNQMLSELSEEYLPQIALAGTIA